MQDIVFCLWVQLTVAWGGAVLACVFCGDGLWGGGGKGRGGSSGAIDAQDGRTRALLLPEADGVGGGEKRCAAWFARAIEGEHERERKKRERDRVGTSICRGCQPLSTGKIVYTYSK